MGTHLIDGEFQSDKYPTTPRGKVPLSTKDPAAQDVLRTYAERRRIASHGSRESDAEFADDVVAALKGGGVNLDDAVDEAWGIIANAFGGRWEDAPPEWRQAAERWRDQYITRRSK